MNKRSPFTISRIFHVVGHGWFFESRKGIRGPYKTKEKAKAELAELEKTGAKREMLFERHAPMPAP